MKAVLRSSSVIVVALGLSCVCVCAQSHWKDGVCSSTYSPATAETYNCNWSINFYHYCQYTITSSGSKAQIDHSIGSGNGENLNNRCNSSGSPGAPLSASITISKKKVHDLPSHTPINALATANGTISFSASVSGTAQTLASSSASASASGSLACAGSTNLGSLSVSGSCTASSIGSISVAKDGVSLGTTSSPPGSYSKTESHVGTLTVQDQQISSSSVTLMGLATVTTSAATASDGVLTICPAHASASASAEISLDLVVECPAGG
jgi:hypothetical protein